MVDFHRTLLTHALALSANQFFMQEKVPICALGENWTHENEFRRHEDNRQTHRGRTFFFFVVSFFQLRFLFCITKNSFSSCFFNFQFWSSPIIGCEDNLKFANFAVAGSYDNLNFKFSGSVHAHTHARFVACTPCAHTHNDKPSSKPAIPSIYRASHPVSYTHLTLPTIYSV